MQKLEELVIGTAEAADVLGVSVATVTRWAESGDLKSIRKLPGRSGSWIFDARVVRRHATRAAPRQVGLMATRQGREPMQTEQRRTEVR